MYVTKHVTVLTRSGYVSTDPRPARGCSTRTAERKGLLLPGGNSSCSYGYLPVPVQCTVYARIHYSVYAPGILVLVPGGFLLLVHTYMKIQYTYSYRYSYSYCNQPLTT